MTLQFAKKEKKKKEDNKLMKHIFARCCGVDL